MVVDWALHRLRELREEYADGESRLLQLERHRVQVQDSLLRVAGGIQVLEELIAASGAFGGEGRPVEFDAEGVVPPAGLGTEGEVAPAVHGAGASPVAASGP